MLSRKILDVQPAPYKLLRCFYRQAGKEIRVLSKVPAGVRPARLQLYEEESSWESFGEDSWAMDDMQWLLNHGLVSARELSNGSTLYRLTPKGLAELRTNSERVFCRQHGLKAVDGQDVIISRVMPVGANLSGHSLVVDSPATYVERVRLNVWGHLRWSDELLLLAKAEMYLIDAEAALHNGGFSLADVMNTHPESRQYLEMICNHDLDGEPATHIYELTDMFGLEEAIGRQLIIVHDVRVAPALIGKRVGREVVQRLIARYGMGGGIAIIPLQPYGSEGEEADQLVFQHLARTSFEPHVVQHPFVKRTLVGDIRKICRLP